MREIRGTRAAVMNEIRLYDIVGAGTVARKSRRMMLLRTILLVINVRNCANRYAQHTVCRCRNSSSIKLSCCPGEVQKRRRIVVSRTDDKRDFILFLEIVKLLREG